MGLAQRAVGGGGQSADNRAAGRSRKSGRHMPQQYTIVDVQELDHREPSKALKTFSIEKPERIEKCDVLIVGGSLGGVSAAMNVLMPSRPGENGLEFSRLQQGRKLKVILTEETDWIGGQATSQGVSALDENWLVESSGATRDYQRWRSMIRRYYLTECKLAPSIGNIDRFNPGNCWVSRLSFEAKLGLDQLAEMLKPAVDARQLQILCRHKPVYVQTEKVGKSKRIKSVVMADLDAGTTIEFRPRIIIDATELGDLLPLAELDYVKGVEAKDETGEDHAPEKADPENVQDIVFPFVIELGDPHFVEPVDEPDEYEEFKSKGKLSLLGYKMFEPKIVMTKDGSERELLPFWTYRRLIAAENFKDPRYPNDLSMINWEANDFRGESIIDVDPELLAKRLARAKSLSLSFFLWLQTEAPRDEGGVGYPEFKLRHELLGSADGLSKFPYIRESRRIKAETTIVEKDIGANYNPGARARLFDDTVGIGYYPIDIHGKQTAGAAQETKPFQIPLGALIPRDCINLLPACKNIGTTHITNGAYRLHPIEWAIGTASGALGRLSLLQGKPIRRFFQESELRLELQKHLIESGSPLFWFDDVPTWHEHFVEIQLLAVAGLMRSDDQDSLSFQPLRGIKRREAARLIRAVYAEAKYSRMPLNDVADNDPDVENLAFAVHKGLLQTDEQGDVRPDDLLTIEELHDLAQQQLVRLPRHKIVFVEAISPERLSSNAAECVTRSEFAMWLALVIDYKKAWLKIDRSIAGTASENNSTAPGSIFKSAGRAGDAGSGSDSSRAKTRKGTRDLPVSAP